MEPTSIYQFLVDLYKYFELLIQGKKINPTF